MKSIVDSIRLNLFERMTSPLFGAFCISWLAWNHRFLMLLTSDLPLPEKFFYIDTFFFPNFEAILIRSFLYPFFSSVLFILIYPLPANLLYSYWYYWHIASKKIRDKIEGATLLTAEESARIRIQMFQAEVEHQASIAHQVEQIEALKKQLSEVNPSNQSLNDFDDESNAQSANSPALEEGTMKIIGLLAKRDGGRATQANIFNIMNLPQVRTQYFLDQGVNKLLIQPAQDGTGNACYELTQDGRRFAVNAQLA